MNIKTVAENLRNTIAGKEQYLESIQEEYKTSVGVDCAVLHSTQAFLAINIAELKRILQDVEQCRPDWTAYLNPVTGEE